MCISWTRSRQVARVTKPPWTARPHSVMKRPICKTQEAGGRCRRGRTVQELDGCWCRFGVPCIRRCSFPSAMDRWWMEVWPHFASRTREVVAVDAGVGFSRYEAWRTGRDRQRCGLRLWQRGRDSASLHRCSWDQVRLLDSSREGHTCNNLRARRANWKGTLVQWRFHSSMESFLGPDGCEWPSISRNLRRHFVCFGIE